MLRQRALRAKLTALGSACFSFSPAQSTPHAWKGAGEPEENIFANPEEVQGEGAPSTSNKATGNPALASLKQQRGAGKKGAKKPQDRKLVSLLSRCVCYACDAGVDVGRYAAAYLLCGVRY